LAVKSITDYFKNASLESYLVDTIEETMWKFIFISALASATSYLNQNIGEIINSRSSRAIYVELFLNELR
jgi:2-dehydropantoate 2-reductase